MDAISPDDSLVLVTGYFDVFHAGHAVFLESCARLGSLLAVGVHSDALAKKHKGENHPRNPIDHRLVVVASLECVDYVFEAATLLDEDIPFLRRFKPDIVVLSTGKDDSRRKLELRDNLISLSNEIEAFSVKILPVTPPIIDASKLV